MLTGNKALMHQLHIKPAAGIEGRFSKALTDYMTESVPGKSSMGDRSIRLREATGGGTVSDKSRYVREAVATSVGQLKPGGYGSIPLNSIGTGKSSIIAGTGLNNTLFKDVVPQGTTLADRTHLRRVFLRHEIDEIRGGQKVFKRNRSINIDNEPIATSTRINSHITPTVLTHESDNLLGMPPNLKNTVIGLRRNAMYGADAINLERFAPGYQYGKYNKNSVSAGEKAEKGIHRESVKQIANAKQQYKGIDGVDFDRLSVGKGRR